VTFRGLKSRVRPLCLTLPYLTYLKYISNHMLCRPSDSRETEAEDEPQLYNNLVELCSPYKPILDHDSQGLQL
jgi:hypothetical protein